MSAGVSLGILLANIQTNEVNVMPQIMPAVWENPASYDATFPHTNVRKVSIDGESSEKISGTRLRMFVTFATEDQRNRFLDQMQKDQMQNSGLISGEARQHGQDPLTLKFSGVHDNLPAIISALTEKQWLPSRGHEMLMGTLSAFGVEEKAQIER